MATITGSGTVVGTDVADGIMGGDLDDALVGLAGNDTLNGGAGFDFAGYWTSLSPISVQLSANIVSSDGFGGADTLISIEGIIGSAHDDVIIGSDLWEALNGYDGKDTIQGLGGDDVLAGNGGDDQITGGAGTDTVRHQGKRADYTVTAITGGFVVAAKTGAEGTDTVTEVEFFSFSDGLFAAAALFPGTTGNDSVTGTAGNDYIETLAGNDTVSSGAGNDTLVGSAGNDLLDGGADLDTVVTEYGFRGVGATLSGSTLTMISAAGTDTLTNVEIVTFADGRLVMDANDPAAQVVRLYEAALDRLPDQGGLNFWIGAVQNGQPLVNLASGFIGSNEFRSRFGDMADNGAFVDQLYLNVLNRPGEAGGRQFWIDSMGKGAGRADVLVAFSNSDENKAGTAALVQTGIWDRSEAATEVARLYDTVFGRLPDAPGLVAWKTVLESGSATLSQVADSFAASVEFRSTYGDLANRQFANALYVNTLDRAADQGGLDYWTGQLDAGMARATVVLAFSESAEHVNLTAKNIQSETPGEFGILFA